MFKGKMLVSGIILTISAVGQVISAFIFYDPEGNVTTMNLGWGVLMVSAFFGWLPIITFRRRGQVEGRGYIHTTVLVDSGIYAIVRHPQYLAGALMGLALTLITPHWLVAVLGLATIIICYLGTFDEEEECIRKFGDAYKQYMQRVPRFNFIAGIVRVIRSRMK
jgi:protein-S-isoprenylcysteine O-methyltransferase Ste14